MDINEQVARRRAELSDRQKHEKAVEKAAAASRQAAEATRREEAVDEVAAKLSTMGVPTHRDGEEVRLTPETREAIDIDALTPLKVDALIKREARDLWTPGDNWLVISCIAGGTALIHIAGVGLIFIGLGWWRRSVLQRRYTAVILQRFPVLAPASATFNVMEQDIVTTPHIRPTPWQRLWWNPNGKP